MYLIGLPAILRPLLSAFKSALLSWRLRAVAGSDSPTFFVPCSHRQLLLQASLTLSEGCGHLGDSRPLSEGTLARVNLRSPAPLLLPSELSGPKT